MVRYIIKIPEEIFEADGFADGQEICISERGSKIIIDPHCQSSNVSVAVGKENPAQQEQRRRRELTKTEIVE